MRSRNFSFLLSLLLIIMSLALVACRDMEPSRLTTPLPELSEIGAPPHGGGDIDSTIIGDPQAIREYLASLDSLTNTYTFEKVIDLSVVVGEEAFASASPDSWGAGYEFSIHIPADALVGSGYLEGEVVNITLSAPVGNTIFANPDLPMPIILLPHGINFLANFQVQASRHPNLNSYCEVGYEIFYVEEGSSIPQLLIQNGFQTSSGLDPECRRNIAFEGDHFSKWYLSKGRPDSTGGGRGFWDWN